MSSYQVKRWLTHIDAKVKYMMNDYTVILYLWAHLYCEAIIGVLMYKSCSFFLSWTMEVLTKVEVNLPSKPKWSQLSQHTKVPKFESICLAHQIWSQFAQHTKVIVNLPSHVEVNLPSGWANWILLWYWHSSHCASLDSLEQWRHNYAKYVYHGGHIEKLFATSHKQLVGAG